MSLLSKEEYIFNTSAHIVPEYKYTGSLKKAIEAANFYGFHLVRPLQIEKKHREIADKYCCPEHHSAALETYLAEKEKTGRKTLRIMHTRKVPYKNELELRLEIIGDKSTSAEALLLRTAKTILEEYGQKDIALSVNSLGGRESAFQFAKEVASYYRAHLNTMEAHCREAFKKNAFAPLHCNHPKCQELKTDAPQAMTFLSEQSRNHFREVLEYIEHLDIPYQINPYLVGSEHYTTGTLFAFQPHHEVFRSNEEDSGEEPTHLAYGERYDQLSRRTGSRKTIPAMHITLNLKTRSAKEKYTPIKNQVPITLHAYVAQVGTPAKMKVLHISENLRRSDMRVSSTLHSQTLSEQLARAKKLNVPAIIIIGQKEVMEDTVIVRHVKSNIQETVPTKILVRYLKRKVRV